VEKDCQSRKLNTEDVMDRNRWRKQISSSSSKGPGTPLCLWQESNVAEMIGATSTESFLVVRVFTACRYVMQ